jgi:hypothetical protein
MSQPPRVGVLRLSCVESFETQQAVPRYGPKLMHQLAQISRSARHESHDASAYVGSLPTLLFVDVDVKFSEFPP